MIDPEAAFSRMPLPISENSVGGECKQLKRMTFWIAKFKCYDATRSGRQFSSLITFEGAFVGRAQRVSDGPLLNQVLRCAEIRSQRSKHRLKSNGDSVSL
jgi:hypothetical protein